MNKSKFSYQSLAWKNKFGDSYTDRNTRSIEEVDAQYLKDYGVSRRSMNSEFLSSLDRSLKILEVGANIGCQLELLGKEGFKNLLGIDINNYAVRQAKHIRPEVDIMNGSVFDLPFRDKYFDLVFTSGVLIHISQKDLPCAMDEIWRVAGSYIWGFEYFSLKSAEIEYKGKKDLLWKRDFSALYLKRFPDLRIVREKRFPMSNGKNVTQMFLLKKGEL